jgi:hypothetical protein
MTIQKTTLFLLSLFIISACQQDKVLINNAADHFFDLPAYFQAEAERLSKIEGLKVRKTVLLDGKSDSKELQIEDWNKELALFAKIQIHSPTQREKYRVDSTIVVSEQLKTVHYQSDDKKANAKSVLLYFKNNELIKIEIQTHSENEVYDAEQQLVYEAAKGFSITKDQKVTLLKQHQYAISLEFLADKNN